MANPEQASLPAATPTAPPAPLLAGFTEGTAQVNRLTLNYVRGGSGPLVVLLHSFPQTWYE